MKVLFTPSARQQFLVGLEYIRADNLVAAHRFREMAGSALARLEIFPESGRSIPEFPDFPHREVVVPPYRFFYRIAGKTIWIMAVWHSAQLPTPPTNSESY